MTCSNPPTIIQFQPSTALALTTSQATTATCWCVTQLTLQVGESHDSISCLQSPLTCVCVSAEANLHQGLLKSGPGQWEVARRWRPWVRYLSAFLAFKLSLTDLQHQAHSNVHISLLPLLQLPLPSRKYWSLFEARLLLAQCYIKHIRQI